MTFNSMEDAKEILDLLETHEDYFVIHIRRLTWGAAYEEIATAECSECETEIAHGADAFMWGEPTGETTAEAKNSKLATLHLFCSEEHAEIYTGRWAEEIGFDEYAVASYG
jgi:endogenous inhibitor of DNA gyrase (YacG/DUF329 family)